MSGNTLQSYQVGLNRFSNFRLTYQLPNLWPPSVDNLVLFFSSLSLDGLTANTARLYKCAIGAQCKLFGFADTTENYIITKIITGMGRNTRAHTTRLPITAQLLCLIVETLPSMCINMYESALFTAAYTLAFFGFFRVGELAVTRQSVVNHTLAFSDVRYTSDGNLLLTLRNSKTDKESKGYIMQINKTGKSVCPVHSLNIFLARRPKINGPLLCHMDGTPLTRTQFSSVLKKCLSVMNLEFAKYNTHSFRIGAATTAAMVGCTTEQIKEAGRWTSDAYKRYVRNENIHLVPNLL